jgi:ATP phosphoribosyltransferase regulatory subunit
VQAVAIRDFMAISATPAEALTSIRELAGRKAKALDAALDAWSARLDALAVPAERLRFAPALGHAFDYYDGLTFEVRSETLGADRRVAVGGRYDGLLARLGGQDGRAVGCMVRPWRAFSGGEA